MYYKELELLPPKEWNAFMNKLKEPLDICFRVNSIDKHKDKILAMLQAAIKRISQDPESNNRTPKKVKWYPSQLAYCFDDVGRVEMRKSTVFKDFHKFLVSETENGRVFRQEKVSMIPVTLLKI